uniref:Uncharacterized protein n=1 Tax=Hucho hucho TaxID=62062 RepID=A0A4W5JED9_9TELE
MGAWWSDRTRWRSLSGLSLPPPPPLPLPLPSVPQEKEMEKQKLLYQQARLHDRGAAEMVLQTISASKGEMGPMVASTLKLGIAVLNGGNSTVQQVGLSNIKLHQPSISHLLTWYLMSECIKHPSATY